MVVMICEIDDLKIYYETHGDGMPVLMIHGYRFDHNVMTGCMEPIFKGRRGWKRIYFDLPGMGRTRADDQLKNSDQMLEIVKQFSEQVIPDGVFLVAGESYGGYLARGLVHDIPQRLVGVLLICPVIIADQKSRDLPPQHVFVRDAELLVGIEPIERKMFERMLVLQDKTRWDRWQIDIFPGIRARDAIFTEQFIKRYGYSFSFDVDKLERPFDKPSLILTGRQDVCVGYRDSLKIVENYPYGTFAILDRAGHGLEVEQEAVFNSMVNEWLDRVEEYNRSESVLHISVNNSNLILK